MSGTVLTREEAIVLVGSEALLPRLGYMRAAELNGQIGWLRHLPVTGILLFTPVESYPFGIGAGTLRKMVA